MAHCVEIRKAGFTNKGAEMMLIATIQKIRERLPHSKIVVAPNYTLPFDSRARLGLWHRAELIKMGFDFGKLVRFVPKKLRERYGFVTDAEVDVVVDAAGFAYSDQWGIAPAKDMAKRSMVWKKQGKRVILLPQAFGPFDGPEIKEAMTKIADNVTLIFARDDRSYRYLVDVVGERENILKAPDFTNLLDVTSYKSSFSVEKNAVAIVPNARMLDKTDINEKGAYLGFLRDSITLCEDSGLRPFFLIHETIDDLKIAEAINLERENPIRVIRVNDALEAKTIIQKCEAMIGSRFHALVSALSLSVPVVGTGWSHKYQELFNDYEYGQGLTKVDLTPDQLRLKLSIILDQESRCEIKSHLKDKSSQIKLKVLSMWDKVFLSIN